MKCFIQLVHKFTFDFEILDFSSIFSIYFLLVS